MAAGDDTVSSELFTPARSPESLGVSSRWITRFLQRIEETRICMHGFIMLRRGRIVAEGYWAPYAADSMHRMYSVSKSFVSLAIGLMIDEGKLGLDDRIVRFFPDKLPQSVHPYIAEATVRDLLMMATPHSRTSYTRHDTDWARTFFEMTPSHPPGTIFSYDTAATVVLGTIVERLSGTTFLDYMRAPMLDSIEFSADAWCIETPEGTSWGGSGVICTLRDMAKVALLCLRGGRWRDRQLISEEYIRAATSKQIDNTIRHGDHGYGYQIWRHRANGFAFRGMGSQLALCFPGEDLVFACIADTQGQGPTGTGIEDPLFEEIHRRVVEESPMGEALPEDPHGAAELSERIRDLHILPQTGAPTSPWMDRVDGVTYNFGENPMGISELRLRFGADYDGQYGDLEYRNAQGPNTLRFGIGRNVAGDFPQRNYFGRRIGTVPGTPYRCLASGAWVDEHTLNILVYITDNYLGTLKMSLAFKGSQIAVFMTKVAEWFLDEYQGFAGGTASPA